MATGAYFPETVSKDLTFSASGHSIVPKSSTEGYKTIPPHSSLEYRPPAPKTLAWSPCFDMCIGGV